MMMAGQGSSVSPGWNVGAAGGYREPGWLPGLGVGGQIGIGGNEGKVDWFTETGMANEGWSVMANYVFDPYAPTALKQEPKPYRPPASFGGRRVNN